MPLSAASWESSLIAQFGSKGFAGSATPDLAKAIAIGSVNALVGKAFTTNDTGTTPGAGTGIGTGITGVVAGAVSSALFAALLSAFGQTGSATQDMCDAIAASLVEQIALATLTTTNAPVFAGTGLVVVGSIAVVGSAWGNAIKNAAPSFQGSAWPDAASAIGTACANAILSSGTGTVVITGSPSGPAVPGVGVGTGTLS